MLICWMAHHEYEKVSNTEDDLDWSGEYQVLGNILTRESEMIKWENQIELKIGRVKIP